MAIGVLFWIFALTLLLLPFAGTPAAPDWGAPDHSRKVGPADGESEDLTAVFDVPFAQDVANFDAQAIEEDYGLPETFKAYVARESERLFGENSELLAASGLIETERLAPGKESYGIWCIGCHGESGDGAGPAATHLDPRPRNFRKGEFKFKGTASGSRPLRRDFFSTITRGLAGSAMPAFNLVPEQKRWDMSAYVRYLSLRGEFEQLMLDLARDDSELPDADEVAGIVSSRWSAENCVPQFPSVSEPPLNMASVDKGRELFNAATGGSCYSCHGKGGLGDGPSAGAYKDAWGYPIAPRDLTEGVFRAGETSKDLYMVIASGIGGSPMPSYSDSIAGEDIWHLVHFVQYLANPASVGGN
ncbi:MAG: cytochrome c oxidase cbb3-type subunit I/II [Planctomycetota bacterium]|jgi:cytochrome c oxidase cbb3-type subunit I/II